MLCACVFRAGLSLCAVYCVLCATSCGVRAAGRQRARLSGTRRGRPGRAPPAGSAARTVRPLSVIPDKSARFPDTLSSMRLAFYFD